MQPRSRSWLSARTDAAGTLGATLTGAEAIPPAVSDSIAALAMRDAPAYRTAIEALVADFEARAEFLEDIAVADTVLALQALAELRGMPVSLASALLPDRNDFGSRRRPTRTETHEQEDVMRKLVESTFVTLDGRISNPQDWSPPYWDEEHNAYASKLLFAADALLLGRATYEGFVQAWPERSGDPYADRINAMPKYVASRTLRDADLELDHSRRRCRRGSRRPQGATW